MPRSWESGGAGSGPLCWSSRPSRPAARRRCASSAPTRSRCSASSPRNVLTTGAPSDRSIQVLERLGAARALRGGSRPARSRCCTRSSRAQGDHRRLSALAELSFYHADRTRRPPLLLRGRRLRLRAALPGPRRGDARPVGPARAPGLRPLQPRPHRGDAPRRRPRWSSHGGHLRAALRHASRSRLPDDELVLGGPPPRRLRRRRRPRRSTGLRNRYRRPGIGAPLSAQLEPERGHARRRERFLPGLRVPATVFLRFEDPRARAERRASCRRASRSTRRTRRSTVAIDGREVPIEFETTSSLAATLAESPLWDFELRGFFSGTFRPLRATWCRTAVVGTARRRAARARTRACSSSSPTAADASRWCWCTARRRARRAGRTS